MLPSAALLLVLAGSGSPQASDPPRDDTGFVVGHAALGGGLGLLALSTAAFLAGFDVEQQLRQAPHERAVVDVLLLRRGVAAAVAWPAAALAAVSAVGGVVVLALDEEPAAGGEP